MESDEDGGDGGDEGASDVSNCWWCWWSADEWIFFFFILGYFICITYVEYIISSTDLPLNTLH